MGDLKKYKEVLIYLSMILIALFVIYKQLQPKFVHTIELFNQIKSQTEVKTSLESQVKIAREKFERMQKMNVEDVFTKKIYKATGIVTDAESTFSVLLDDFIEIARKNHIKIYSIKPMMNPKEDVFVSGDGANYSVNKMDMKIVSNYSDFENFISDLFKYPYLINLNSIEIYPYEKDKRVLLINLTITMYSYRDPSDVSTENIEKNAPSAQQENNSENNPAPAEPSDSESGENQ
ncbi:type 4a pilus biogenesis protein PilO [bacterium]|nr:type 4a pilus biogenesis protein PilO [bacterium]